MATVAKMANIYLWALFIFLLIACITWLVMQLDKPDVNRLSSAFEFLNEDCCLLIEPLKDFQEIH